MHDSAGHGRPTWSPMRSGAALLAAAVVATVAILIWIGVGNRTAGVGVRINVLVAQRQQLLTRRAEARIRLAEATHPETLDKRARALGLRPGAVGDDESPLVVALPAGDPAVEPFGTDSVLAIRIGATGAMTTTAAGSAIETVAAPVSGGASPRLGAWQVDRRRP